MEIPVNSYSLEQSLDSLDDALDNAALSVKTAASELKKLHKLAAEGDLKGLKKRLLLLREMSAELVSRFEVINTSFTPPSEKFFTDGAFQREVIEVGKQNGMTIFEVNGTLVAFPNVVKVHAAEPAAEINRRRVSHLRPSRLVQILRAAKDAGPRVPPKELIEVLHRAYETQIQKASQTRGSTVRLVDIFELLTILPKTVADYSKEDFVRDLYTLDASGIVQTKTGNVLTLPASTGTKGTAHMEVVTASGELKPYYGIAFR
jgi:hypothetical protein